MARCKSCGADVLWATTEAGKSMPIDQDPVETGTLALEGESVRYVGKSESYDGPRYVSHFATCPGAATFRRARQPGGR